MRKQISVLMLAAVLLLMPFFQSCGGDVYHSETETCEYTLEHMEQLEQCVDKLMEDFPHRRNYLYQIWYTPRGNNRLVSYNLEGKLGEYTASEYTDETIQQLFEDGHFTLIEIREKEISFHCNYYAATKKVSFLLRGDDPRTIYGYDPYMHYEQKGDGIMGQLPNSDNSFYYRKLAEQVYYSETRL